MPLDPFLSQSQDSGGPQMPQLKAGQRLFNQRYELLRALGAGGMGVVWLARDHTEEIEVALKFLPSVLVLQETEMKRLREEVRAGKELRHSGLVGTYGMEVENGIAAIVMEFVPGQTLKEKLEAQERGFFEPEEIAAWVQGIGAGLTHLHEEARRIHRDLKPANIIVDDAGRARLMDFGISHRIKESVSKHSKTSDGTAGSSSSTLAYASPQQLSGRPSDKADDLYSLGATLYELLTGTPPFFRGDAELVRGQIKHEPVTPIQERRQELVDEGLNASTGKALPAKVQQTVLACLSKEREQRPNAENIVQSFRPSENAGKQDTSLDAPRRNGLKPLAALAMLALLGLGVWTFVSQPKENKATEPAHVVPASKKPTTGVVPAPPTLTLDQRLESAEGRVMKLAPSFRPAKGATVEERLVSTIEAFRSLNTSPPPASASPGDAAEDQDTVEGRLRRLEYLLDALSYPSIGEHAFDATPATAQKDHPFINSLGMKFVPVPIGAGESHGKRVLFSIWETRSKDYAAFIRSGAYSMSGSSKEDWKNYSYKNVPVGRGEGESAEDSSHPVANVSHDDAVAFCAWLTKKDRASGLVGPQDEYRLPSDMEWSSAVGIGGKEDASASPKEKDKGVKDVYPWGTTFPPPAGSGNYADTTAKVKGTDLGNSIEGYTDDFATTAPVGSFKPNALGIYDLGGNLWEWTRSSYEPGSDRRVLRGASWGIYGGSSTLSSYRDDYDAGFRGDGFGFRCVLVVGGGQ